MCGKTGPGKAQKTGEGIKQWTDVTQIAVHMVVSVWYQRTTQEQRPGGLTLGVWSASVTLISTTGRTTTHVINIFTNYIDQ